MLQRQQGKSATEEDGTAEDEKQAAIKESETDGQTETVTENKGDVIVDKEKCTEKEGKGGEDVEEEALSR